MIAILVAWGAITSLGLAIIVGTWLYRAGKVRQAEDQAALAGAVEAAKALPLNPAQQAALAAWYAVPEPVVWPVPDATDWIEAVERAGFPPPVDMPGDDRGQPRRHPQA